MVCRGGPTVVSVAFTRENGWLLFNCAPLTPVVILCFGDLGRARVMGWGRRIRWIRQDRDNRQLSGRFKIDQSIGFNTHAYVM